MNTEQKAEIARARGNPSSDAIGAIKRAICRYPLLEPEEESALIRRAQAGDDRAMEALVNHNLRFILSEAKKYVGRGVPYDVLCQSAAIGVMTAVRTFDFERANRLSTHMTWRVRAEMTKILRTESWLVRLPVHLHDLKSKARTQARLFHQRRGRPPTPEELAAAVGVDTKKLQSSLSAFTRSALLSLDQPIVGPSGKQGTTLGDLDLEPEDKSANPWKSLEYLDLRDALEKCPAKERLAIRLYYGIDGPERTIDEVAAALGLARSSARSLLCRARERLRLLMQEPESSRPQRSPAGVSNG